jgi:hypothetical protein
LNQFCQSWQRINPADFWHEFGSVAALPLKAFAATLPATFIC